MAAAPCIPTIILALSLLIYKVIKREITAAEAGSAIMNAGLFMGIVIVLMLLLAVIGLFIM